MKVEDRPIWFDVYRQFPPIEEPKFARSKPDTSEPIPKIFYEEDVLRAKFNTKIQGTVNMLNQSGETHMRRLIREYERLKSEFTNEDELIERASIAAKEAAVSRQHTSNTSQAANEAKADLNKILND